MNTTWNYLWLDENDSTQHVSKCWQKKKRWKMSKKKKHKRDDIELFVFFFSSTLIRPIDQEWREETSWGVHAEKCCLCHFRMAPMNDGWMDCVGGLISIVIGRLEQMIASFEVTLWMKHGLVTGQIGLNATTCNDNSNNSSLSRINPTCLCCSLWKMFHFLLFIIGDIRY